MGGGVTGLTGLTKTRLWVREPRAEVPSCPAVWMFLLGLNVIPSRRFQADFFPARESVLVYLQPAMCLGRWIGSHFQ